MKAESAPGLRVFRLSRIGANTSLEVKEGRASQHSLGDAISCTHIFKLSVVPLVVGSEIKTFAQNPYIPLHKPFEFMGGTERIVYASYAIEGTAITVHEKVQFRENLLRFSVVNTLDASA